VFLQKVCFSNSRFGPLSQSFFFMYVQDEFTTTSSYEVHSIPKLLSPKDGAPSGSEPSTSASRMINTGITVMSNSLPHIKRMKNVRVTQASVDNLEKATALLRSAYVFYRDSFSGPFPNGINVYHIQPGKFPVRTEGPNPHLILPGGLPVGAEALDLSTPRKLLMWAFALVHGRAGTVAEAVKYCEEQAKVYLNLKAPSKI
jgi:hypothetical protein